MHHASRAGVPFIRGDSPSVFSGLYLVEYMGMIPCFDPKDSVTPRVMERLDGGSVRTQAVFSDDELEMGMIAAQRGDEAAIPAPCRFVLYERCRNVSRWSI